MYHGNTTENHGKSQKITENHGKSRKGFFMPITEIVESLVRELSSNRGGVRWQSDRREVCRSSASCLPSFSIPVQSDYTDDLIHRSDNLLQNKDLKDSLGVKRIKPEMVCVCVCVFPVCLFRLLAERHGSLCFLCSG